MHHELKVLNLASSFFLFASGLFGPIYAVFVEEIGGGLITAGLAYSIFSIAAGVLTFLISRWEDHVKQKEKLVVAGYFLASIGFLGYLLIRNPLDLYIVQIIFGISTAVRLPAFYGVYSKHLDHGKSTSEWGILESMAWIVTGVSAIVGAFLANLYGFKTLFLIMFIISLFSFIASLFLTKMIKFK